VKKDTLPHGKKPTMTTMSALNAQIEQRLQNDYKIDLDLFKHACSVLPQNYNYEIPKTLDKILAWKAKNPTLEKYKVSL